MLRSPSFLVRGGETCDYLCRSLCVVRRCDRFFFAEKKKRREEKSAVFQKKGFKILSNHSPQIFRHSPLLDLFVTTNDSIKTHTYNKKELSISRSNKMMMMCVRCCVIHFSTFRYSRSRIAWCCCDCDWCSLFSFVRVSTRAGVAWCQIGVQKPAHAFSFFLFKDAKHTDRVFFDRAGTFFFFQTSIKKNSPFFWLILSKNTHK